MYIYPCNHYLEAMTLSKFQISWNHDFVMYVINPVHNGFERIKWNNSYKTTQDNDWHIVNAKSVLAFLVDTHVDSSLFCIYFHSSNFTTIHIKISTSVMSGWQVSLLWRGVMGNLIYTFSRKIFFFYFSGLFLQNQKALSLICFNSANLKPCK